MNSILTDNYIVARIYAINRVQRRNNERGATNDTELLRLFGDSFARVCDVDTLDCLVRGVMTMPEAALLQYEYANQTH